MFRGAIAIDCKKSFEIPEHLLKSKSGQSVTAVAFPSYCAVRNSRKFFYNCFVLSDENKNER
jgi:hypothetical protein